MEYLRGNFWPWESLTHLLLYTLYLCAHPGTILLDKHSGRPFTPWLFTLHFHDLNGTQEGRRRSPGQTTITSVCAQGHNGKACCFVSRGRHVTNLTQPICAQKIPSQPTGQITPSRESWGGPWAGWSSQDNPTSLGLGSWQSP